MVKILQLRNFFTHTFFKNTRFLPSIFLSVILIGVIVQIYGVNNLPSSLNTLQQQHAQYTAQLTHAKISQQQLQQQLSAVTHNSESLESRARFQLGFIKQGEKFYYFPPQNNNNQ
jgi:cell division protein FtsB